MYMRPARANAVCCERGSGAGPATLTGDHALAAGLNIQMPEYMALASSPPARIHEAEENDSGMYFE